MVITIDNWHKKRDWTLIINYCCQGKQPIIIRITWISVVISIFALYIFTTNYRKHSERQRDLCKKGWKFETSGISYLEASLLRFALSLTFLKTGFFCALTIESAQIGRSLEETNFRFCLHRVLSRKGFIIQVQLFAPFFDWTSWSVFYTFYFWQIKNNEIGSFWNNFPSQILFNEFLVFRKGPSTVRQFFFNKLLHVHFCSSHKVSILIALERKTSVVKIAQNEPLSPRLAHHEKLTNQLSRFSSWRKNLVVSENGGSVIEISRYIEPTSKRADKCKCRDFWTTNCFFPTDFFDKKKMIKTHVEVIFRSDEYFNLYVRRQKWLAWGKVYSDVFWKSRNCVKLTVNM